MAAEAAQGQDATQFSPAEVNWRKPPSSYADSAGMAQRVDPNALGSCGTGKVLTLGANGAFSCTDTIANASYASNSGYANDAGTVGGQAANQLGGTFKHQASYAFGGNGSSQGATTGYHDICFVVGLYQNGNNGWVYMTPGAANGSGKRTWTVTSTCAAQGCGAGSLGIKVNCLDF